MWVNRDESIAKQILSAHRTVYFSQLLKTNFLSETIVSQAQLNRHLFIRNQQSVKYIQI